MRSRESRPRVAVALALVLTSLGIAGAQGLKPIELPEPQPVTTLGAPPLLHEPAVQREIGLTSKQRQNLANVEADAAQARQVAMTPGEEEGEVDFNTLINQAQNVERERGAALNRVLTNAQRNRLTQLQWQRDGWLALKRPEVATRIKLKPNQSRQIARIIETLQHDQTRALLGGPEPDQDTTKTKPTPKSTRDLNPRNGFIDPNFAGVGDGTPLDFSTEGMANREKHSVEVAGKFQKLAKLEVDKILAPEQKKAFLDLLGPRFDFQSLDPNAPPRPAARPGSRK